MEIACGDWLPILWTLLNTGGGCYCCFSAIGWLPVQTVAICGYMEPLPAESGRQGCLSKQEFYKGHSSAVRRRQSPSGIQQGCPKAAGALTRG